MVPAHPKGNFSKASLNGQYVYQIEGFDFTTNLSGVAYREAGVFTADGNGNITSATDDFSEGNTFLTTSSTGSYTISNDGTGSLSFDNALGTIQLAVTLVSSSKVYLVEGDQALNGGGLAEKQDLTAIAAAPSGTFVFREHDLNATQSVASVGAFTVTGGIVSNGNEDVNRGGTFSSLTFTGSFNGPDSSTGRGTGTFTDNSPATSSFVYYIVDANNVRFMAQTVGVNGLGRAELQSGTPALSGSYAFGSEGDTSFLGGVNMAGRFNASGGNITMGARDSVQDGSVASNVSFTGTYTQAVNGRALVTLLDRVKPRTVDVVSPRADFLVMTQYRSRRQPDLQQVSILEPTMNGQFAFAERIRRGCSKRWAVAMGCPEAVLNEFTNAAGAIAFRIYRKLRVSAMGEPGLSAALQQPDFYLVSAAMLISCGRFV